MNKLCMVNMETMPSSIQPCDMHRTAVSDRPLTVDTSVYLSENFPTSSSLVIFFEAEVGSLWEKKAVKRLNSNGG